MIIVFICAEFKWTYQQYMDTPEWFIDLIKKKIDIDGRKQKNKR
jgi:hypothetical protein